GGGAPWRAANAAANSGTSPRVFHSVAPSGRTLVCAFARPSVIHCLTWSVVTGPYSLPSVPIILYIDSPSQLPRNGRSGATSQGFEKAVAFSAKMPYKGMTQNRPREFHCFYAYQTERDSPLVSSENRYGRDGVGKPGGARVGRR